MYLYEDSKWPHFYYDINCCLDLLNAIFLKYGLLLGKITSIKTEDLDLDKLHTNSLADEIVCSSQIEGEFLDRNAILESINVRFSNSFNVPSSAQYEDGIVAMMLDATQNYDKPLTCERLCAWQEKLFTREYVGFYKIVVGAFRSDRQGPMLVSSQKHGQIKVHYQAPKASDLPSMLSEFISFINSHDNHSPYIKAAIAHLYFLTLHPFEDGSGRISRAICEYLLSKAEKSSKRLYSVSAQIQKHKLEYYDIVEKTQKGDLNITKFVRWFLSMILNAIEASLVMVDKAVEKSLFFQKIREVKLSKDQNKIVNMLLDGFEGKLTSKKFAKIAKTSQDTATRSLNYLIDHEILVKEGAGPSTHYLLKFKPQ